MIKRGQLTVFILVAILIVAGVVLFFIFRGNLGFVQIPASIQPAYNSFLTCLEENTISGIDVLESQAGYILLPDFEPGSAYMPFSSHLDFLGNPIPYWYYVSGNNIQKEQIPSKADMEEQLGIFIEEKIRNCNFETYYEQGFEINFGEPKVNIDINDDSVGVSLDLDMGVGFGEDNVVIRSHRVNVDSSLGALYDSAKKVYDYEQDNLFLEDYAVDNLRLYAPVDGVEITCSPLVWNADDIFDSLEESIESNTQAINVINNDYFKLDLSTEHDIRFLNSRTWPNGFEVLPSEGAILMSSPIGNQPGLGILGFCYVPYHFVYNIRYPVLVQISDNDEIFQFPMAVVIQGNRPRKALQTSAVNIEVPQLCEQKNTLIEVNIFDTNLNSIDAEISYECSGTKCSIGDTSSGFLEENFPQCVNGFIIAKASGFKDTKHQFSVVESGIVDVIMDRLYELEIKLKLDNSDYDGQAIVSFISTEKGVSNTIVYPEQKTVELSEGQYEIQVYIYRESSLNIGATTTKECVEVPRTGIGGFFGFTREKCFNIDFPSQVISNALAGGGKQNYFAVESVLVNSKIIEINAESLPVPGSIEQLQNNYLLFEEQDLEIEFK